jgi:hypothetical protein
MAATTKAPEPLTDEQLQEMLGLLKGADTVELKLTIPASGMRSAGSALGIDPLDAQVRQIFFFDTPDLKLNEQGVVVRARRIQGRPHDSVVKLRPVVPDELSQDLRRSAGLGVEVDAMPGGFVCSASMKGAVGTSEIRAVAAGDRAIRKLFSKQQRAFYAAHAPDGLALDDLAILGPIFVLKLKHVPKGLRRKLVAEIWLYPDGSRIVELSTKCLPKEAFQVATEARVFLSERGVDLKGEQQTKTKAALEFFSKELASRGSV